MKCRKSMAGALTLVLLLGCSAVRAQMGYIVGTWAAAPVEFPANGEGGSALTIREFAHVSISSGQFTIVTLSNEFGHEPLTVGAVTLAHRAGGSKKIDSSTDTPVAVTFDGKPSVTIAPGKRVRSDSIHFTFPAQSEIAVSIYLPPQPMTSITAHGFANTTNYVADGDQTAVTQLQGAKEMGQWRYLVELDTATATQHSIVCLGDSITDGYRSTKNANRRWTDRLTERLLTDKRFGEQLGVLNEGINANRVLRDGFGPSALNRFERDVLDTDGYYADGRRYFILFEGINDIGHAYNLKTPRDGLNRPVGNGRVSPADLIAAYRYMAERAHASGLKVFGATLTPYVGAGNSSPDGENVREAVNQWIRTTKDLDGVIDFDAIVRDPEDPHRIRPVYDSGDHLHPNDAGYKAMGDGIDLKLFEK